MKLRETRVPGSRRHSRLFARLFLERLQREDSVTAGPCHNESVARRCPKLLNKPPPTPLPSLLYLQLQKGCVIHRPKAAHPSRRSPATTATKQNPAKCIRRRELLQQIRGSGNTNQSGKKKRKIGNGRGRGVRISGNAGK